MTARHIARFALLVPLLAVATAILVTATEPPIQVAPFEYLFDAATGVILAVAGLVAWERRPGWRTGPLLVASGYLWYVGSLHGLVPPGTSIPFLGFAFRGYYDVILALVVLAVPGDRLRGGLERVAIVALAASMLVRTAWRLVGTQPGVGPGNGPDAPANPILLILDIERFIDGDVLLSAVVGFALWLVAVAALRRLLDRRSGARRTTDPVLLAGAAWAGLAGLYAVSDLVVRMTGVWIVPETGLGWALQYLIRAFGPIGILVGMIRLRAGSEAAVALLATGDGPPRGEDLERALRRALGDDRVQVLYAASDGGWARYDGASATLPAADSGRAVTILETGDRVTGAVVHDESLLDDPVVVRTVGAVVGLAVDNARLQDDLQEQLEEVRASRTRIVEAADAERRRVERDLHDGAQQRLVALAVSIRTIRSRLGPEVPPEAATELAAAAEEVRAAIAELRELAQGLDPAILREAGLGAAVQSLADLSAVPVQVDLDLDARLPAGAETAAYFVAAEALANVAKHAQATTVQVSGGLDGERLRLAVTDDGVGGADINGSGLRGLVDRIAAVGGTFEISTPPGGGTRIEVTIPCAS